MLKLCVYLFMLGEVIISSLCASRDEDLISSENNDINIDAQTMDTNPSDAQNDREEQMRQQLNQYLCDNFVQDELFEGTVAAMNDLIHKGCYFPATFEENEWLILCIYSELQCYVSKEQLAQCMKTGDWNCLNAIYSYRQVAERTHL
ncbi:MAG: hypothetical protein LBP31_00530 [Holosporales bacterium]|nr:hypothetical protein [Holosporales bacterium]